MTSRALGLLLLLVALGLALVAARLSSPISYDPLGPRLFPLVCAGMLAGFALLLAARSPLPLPISAAALRPLGKMIAVLVLYRLLLPLLGALPAMTLCLYLLCRLFGSRWTFGLLFSLSLSLALFSLIRFVFDVPVPMGTLLT